MTDFLFSNPGPDARRARKFGKDKNPHLNDSFHATDQ